MSSGAKKDYEVGYGKPPKATQFMPGQSGNPKGRKKGPKSIRSQVQKLMSRKVAINDKGRIIKKPVQEVMLLSIVQKAAKGDLRAASFLLKLEQAPEYADKETINPNTLSSEDKALFDEMMTQFLGSGAVSEACSTKGEEG